MIRSFKGHMPRVPESCYVDVSAQVIGDVTLDEDVSIWMNAVVRGDVHSIHIGARSNVQDCAVIHGMRGRYAVRIGEGVSIAHGAVVHGCVIENDCLIGIGAKLLNNVRVGSCCLIGAGTLLPEGMSIPPRSLVLGSPGKVIRSLSDEEVETIRGFSRNYLGYKADYKAELAAAGLPGI